MKRIVFVVATLLAACAPPEQQETAPPPSAAASTTQAGTDGAGNRLEALAPSGDRHCSADDAWCIDATGMITGPDGVQRAITTNLRESEEQAPWPWIIRLAGDEQRALIGQTYTSNDMYSGGGASGTWLTLYEVSAGRDQVTPMMSVLIDGSAMIRACFDEDDARERFDACHDEYRFSGALMLDPATQSGAPRLIYATEASTYPGRRSRMTDSAETPPRSREDLVWAADETCTFQRTFTRGAEGYAPDQPLPECSGYQTQ